MPRSSTASPDRTVRSARQGFSLIEVLLSLTITALTVIAVMSLLSTGRTLLHGPEILQENHRRLDALRTGLTEKGFSRVFSWISDGKTRTVASYTVWVKPGAPVPFTATDLVTGAESLAPSQIEERNVVRDLDDAADVALAARDRTAITRPVFVAVLKASSGRAWQPNPVTGTADAWPEAGLSLDATIKALPSNAIAPSGWKATAEAQSALMTVPLVIRR